MLKELQHSEVKLLVVHCTATRCNRPFSVESLINTGKIRFGQCSYHYYVRRNGEIIPLLPETVQGIHAKHYNHCSLGVVSMRKVILQILAHHLRKPRCGNCSRNSWWIIHRRVSLVTMNCQVLPKHVLVSLANLNMQSFNRSKSSAHTVSFM